MDVIKFYDACCSKCGNWYTSDFKAPRGKTKKEAIAEMKANGWGVVGGKTYCHKCH
ncbi:hypothetical protein EP10_003416 [Geobacillus icigianus]|uniref:Uncharacterized protein n=1 Tax=Geobacillus icigianus TaxID=1430331 RepID=A0ABU6BKY8_9BACL|nr:hypothetical protein [Geobacillus icigianus]